jgi:hypothetical protein
MNENIDFRKGRIYSKRKRKLGSGVGGGKRKIPNKKKWFDKDKNAFAPYTLQLEATAKYMALQLSE